MALLKAFFDESGVDGRSKYTIVGGALNTQMKWMGLGTRWRSALKKFKVSGFHAVDLNNYDNEFTKERGWDETRRREFTSCLLTILDIVKPLPIGIAVDNQAFERIRASEFPELSISPYQFCCERCCVEITRLALKNKQKSPIAVAFEKGQKRNSLGLQRLEKGLDLAYLQERWKLKSVRWIDGEGVREIEVADLIVSEISKETNKTDDRKIRYTLIQLLQKHGMPVGGIVSEKVIRGSLKATRDYLYKPQKK